MRKVAVNTLVGTGIAAVALGVASHSVTNYMMKVALDREAPKIKNMERAREYLCGIPNAAEFFRVLDNTGRELERSNCEVIKIDSYDGEKLVGHWHFCKEAERVIIAVHGWRSQWWRDFGMIAEFWHSNRCSVLYIEQRGQNNSGGDYIGFGLTERFDCPEWVKWINRRCGSKLPVYLAGVSMGATTVLMATGLDMPDNVCGVIADCGFTSPEEIWRYVARHNLHLSYGLRSVFANGICKKKIHMAANEYSTVEALRGSRIPVLFVHGTDDHFVPVEMTYENYKACVAPKYLFVVPGADHGMSYLVDREGYQRALRNFWRKTIEHGKAAPK